MAYKIKKPIKKTVKEVKEVKKVKVVEVKSDELAKDYKGKDDAIITNPTVG